MFLIHCKVVPEPFLSLSDRRSPAHMAIPPSSGAQLLAMPLINQDERSDIKIHLAFHYWKGIYDIDQRSMDRCNEQISKLRQEMETNITLDLRFSKSANSWICMGARGSFD